MEKDVDPRVQEKFSVFEARIVELEKYLGPMMVEAAVSKLDSLDPEDPGTSHSKADEILRLWATCNGGSKVVQAYNRLKRKCPWWCYE